jgi:hypothetical protein
MTIVHTVTAAKAITVQNTKRYSVLSGAAEPSQYLRLVPDQANGHEAVALTYGNEVPSEQLTRYINTIGEPRCLAFTVFSNV